MLLILVLFAGMMTLAALGILVFSAVRLKATKQRIYKILSIVCGAYLFCIVALFVWRIADVAFSPRAIVSADGSLVLDGERYILDSYDEFPYGEDLKQVAIVAYSSDSKGADLFGDIFFPSRLYVQSNDVEKNVLWERGLMLELKYKKVD